MCEADIGGSSRRVGGWTSEGVGPRCTGSSLIQKCRRFSLDEQRITCRCGKMVNICISQLGSSSSFKGSEHTYDTTAGWPRICLSTTRGQRTTFAWAMSALLGRPRVSSKQTRTCESDGPAQRHSPTAPRDQVTIRGPKFEQRGRASGLEVHRVGAPDTCFVCLCCSPRRS